MTAAQVREAVWATLGNEWARHADIQSACLGVARETQIKHALSSLLQSGLIERKRTAECSWYRRVGAALEPVRLGRPTKDAAFKNEAIEAVCAAATEYARYCMYTGQDDLLAKIELVRMNNRR